MSEAEDTMRGQNIICFAKDWNEDPTSCNHVLNELAKHNKVLWLNSISTRAPSLTSGRDLGKIRKKLAAFFAGAKKAEENLWVYTPLVLPLHHKKWAVSLNRVWLRFTLKRLARQLGMKEYQLWTFVPTSSEYVGSLGESLLVYYCTDNWSAFKSVNGAMIGDMVNTLAKKADVVFATSHSLVEKLRPNNPNAHLAAHGVSYAQFATALSDTLAVPEDMASLPGKVIGYYGLIEEWFDLDLVAFLAERHPEWSIALIGAKRVDTSPLDKYSNVHFLGRKPHAELPAYCKGMSVGLIPHHVNELTRHMNPIKLREYLSTGLPVVSVALPEVAYYGDLCSVAPTYETFEQGIVDALATETPETRRLRSERMKSETWENKVADLSRIVLDTQERKETQEEAGRRAVGAEG